MFALLGRKRTQLHGLVGAIDTMAHLDDIEALKSSFSKALETKSDFELSTRVVWPDGALHWLMSRGRTYNDAEGNVARLEGIAVDVTLVKQAELDALARAERETLINEVEQRWRTMLDGDRIRCVAVEALGRALSLDRCFFSTVSIEDDRIQVGPDYSVAHLTTLAGQYRISGLEIDQNDLFPNGHLLAVSDLRTSDLPAAVVERI